MEFRVSIDAPRLVPQIDMLRLQQTPDLDLPPSPKRESRRSTRREETVIYCTVHKNCITPITWRRERIFYPWLHSDGVGVQLELQHTCSPLSVGRRRACTNIVPQVEKAEHVNQTQIHSHDLKCLGVQWVVNTESVHTVPILRDA